MCDCSVIAIAFGQHAERRGRVCRHVHPTEMVTIIWCWDSLSLLPHNLQTHRL